MSVFCLSEERKKKGYKLTCSSDIDLFLQLGLELDILQFLFFFNFLWVLLRDESLQLNACFVFVQKILYEIGGFHRMIVLCIVK